MAKAYDRVSWAYTCLILRRMGFNEIVIDMMWRTMSNNWYSVVINGTRHGFFHSTRGLKQGDPLSPSLFVLGADCLSRMLNKLNDNELYHGFYMERRGPQVNHLAFADDVIIFTSGRKKSLQLIMHTLKNYEEVSGQKINKQKSHYMIPTYSFPITVKRIEDQTGFTRKEAPLTYLGCPLYIGRRRICYFSEMISKAIARIRGWQTRLLSYGGRVTLIKHVLNSLPIHMLSAISPPKTSLKQFEQLAADFFWGMEHSRKKYHWASWKRLCLPVNEGGIGLRRMKDVCKSLELKQWWAFRSKKSLWGDFLITKYCKRSHPISKKWHTNQSLTWKKMMQNKVHAERFITWSVHSGSSSFWWDNWLGSGPLAPHCLYTSRPNSIPISSFLNNGEWNTHKLHQTVSPDIIRTILAFKFNYHPDKLDQPVWNLNSDGSFSCSTAWNSVRESKPISLSNSLIWHRYIPFKCSFLVWRALRNKLPTDDRVTSFGNAIVSKCVCCFVSSSETVDHIFATGNLAKKIWNTFSASLGIDIRTYSIRGILIQWWILKYVNEAQRLLFQALPVIICWALWKNRCSSKYGNKNSNYKRVLFVIISDMYKFLKTVFPYISWPASWPDMSTKVERCTQVLKITKVLWSKPSMGWVKLNTDGSALGNPGITGAGGIVRDHLGDTIWAYAAPLGMGTNNSAEARAVLIGLQWCISHGLTRIHLESDSKMLVQWINKKEKGPWNLTYLLEMIQQITTNLEDFSATHIFREANAVADALSKHSHQCRGYTVYFNSNQDLPLHILALSRMDKIGLHSFRRRKVKRIFEPP